MYVWVGTAPLPEKFEWVGHANVEYRELAGVTKTSSAAVEAFIVTASAQFAAHH